MIIDYTQFDRSTVQTIKAIENKGHVRYIRYLLSKKIPVTTLRKELARLALSAPERTTLSVYFSSVMIPLIETYGLSEYYQSYYNTLVNGGVDGELIPVLSFDISFKDRDQDRISFCSMVRDLEIEEMWSREVTRYYGGIHNIPQNKNGERIMKINPVRSVESVLTCQRKYIIDKLILENVSVPRIVRYLLEKYQIKLEEASVYAYVKYFFNYERKEIEEMVDQLLAEQKSLKSELEIIENNDAYSLGDKLAITKQYQDKIDFIEEIVKDLSAKYSDLTYQQGLNEKLDVKAIVDDIIVRGYNRLKLLDSSRDRDVVKPITDISKMIFSAIDKKSYIAEADTRTRKGAIERDKNVSEVLIEMYQESYDNHINSMQAKLETSEDIVDDVDIIEGLDEV